MKKVILVFGTRPEAIKMCPLVNELKTRDNIETIVCVTGQHRQMMRNRVSRQAEACKFAGSFFLTKY